MDFLQEAKNSRQTAEHIANEPLLRDKVYIPKVYEEYSTKKVMVAEWIDGVRLSDKAGVYRLMGEPLPKKIPSELDDEPDVKVLATPERIDPHPPAPSSPSPSSFQYPARPLKGGVKSIMQTMTELFSAQMFHFGQVHCDPHPGNVLVRPSPSDPRRAQVVLLDHGLYVQLPQEFRREWAALWRAMLVGDFRGVQKVATGWGFGLPDLVASFVMMRPTVLKNGREPKRGGAEKPKSDAGAGAGAEAEDGEKKQQPMTEYELSVKMKEKLKEFLADTDRMPKAIVFLNRNLRMMQGACLNCVFSYARLHIWCTYSPFILSKQRVVRNTRKPRQDHWLLGLQSTNTKNEPRVLRAHPRVVQSHSIPTQHVHHGYRHLEDDMGDVGQNPARSTSSAETFEGEGEDD